MEHKIIRLNEEIARWAFEITVKNNSTDWIIAFTNPTAGPWKTIKYFDENGMYGEVYRFALEENRPDILLVNDKLRVVLIVEAKDSIQKLTEGNQVQKSCQVVADLSAILKSRRSNRYWGIRSDYTVIAGLLWGAEAISSESERRTLFDTYRAALGQFPNIDKKYIVGIESFHATDDTIKCYYYVDVDDAHPNQLADAIVRSLSLQE